MNNSIKKITTTILSALVCFMLLFSVASADTQMSVSLTDVRNGIITISGTIEGAEEGTLVSILIMNPGFEPDDAETDKTAAQHQYVALTDEDGRFSHSCRLSVDSDFEMDSFPVYVYCEEFDEQYYDDFYYSSFTKLLEYAKSIYSKLTADGIGEDTTEAEALRDEVASYMVNAADLLGVDDRFYGVSSKNVADGLIGYFADNKIDFGTESDEPDVKNEKELAGIETVIEQINRYAIFAAFNEGKGELVFDSDNKIVVDEKIGLTKRLSENSTLDKIIEDIDATGLGAICKALLSQGIEDEDDIAHLYAKNVFLYGIKNNTSNGWDYVSEILTKENADYAGYDISEYLELNSVDKANASIVERRKSLTLANLESEIKYCSQEEDSEGSNVNKPSYGGGGGGVSIGTLLESTKEEQQAATNEIFSDISTYIWAKPAIEALAKKGIINGIGNGLFQPQGLLTREQAVKIVCLACKLDTASADNAVFADETEGAWYQSYLAVARGNGIINGQGGNLFGVGSLITREEFVTMLYRALNVQSEEANTSFADSADVSDFAANAVAYFANRQIVNGYQDGSFRPKASISRAEASKVVYELLNRGEIK